MMSIERLRECVEYDPVAGAFTWRRRPDRHFTSSQAARRWNPRFAGTPAFMSSDRNYRYSRLDGRKIYAHRAAWAISHGFWPKEVDHKDGDPSNNCLANLRAADRFTNNCNVRSARGSSSQFLGVYWSAKDRRWVAQITKKRSTTVLGYFRDEAEAARAYDRAAKRLHGEFARLNLAR